MQPKKSNSADLNQKRSSFFFIGLTFSCAFTLVAFEWRTYFNLADDFIPGAKIEVIDNEVLPPITRVKPVVPKLLETKPKPTSKITTSPNIVEVSNNIDVEPIDLTIPEPTDIVEIPTVEYIEPSDPGIFIVVEDMPSFPGGESELFKFMGKNLKYPDRAKNVGIQGRVFVEFLVSETGEITNIKVLSGIGGGCDEEAIRIVKKMPNWIPGKQRGKPVKVQFNLPINFKLI